jgi:hypothetical protein
VNDDLARHRLDSGVSHAGLDHRPPLKAFTREQIDDRYAIECVDYGAHRAGDWLLVAAGTGIMMATMDMEPRFRYSLDTDLLLRTPAVDKFGAWLMLYERLIVSRVCAVGWFSRWENGVPMATWLACLTNRPLVYFGENERRELWSHCDLAHSMGEFLDKLAQT